MVQGKTIKLMTPTSEMVVEDIEEYVCGFSYFYVRFFTGGTQSFNRDTIMAAYRKLPTGDWRQIHLKKAKIYEEDTHLHQHEVI